MGHCPLGLGHVPLGVLALVLARVAYTSYKGQNFPSTALAGGHRLIVEVNGLAQRWDEGHEGLSHHLECAGPVCFLSQWAGAGRQQLAQWEGSLSTLFLSPCGPAPPHAILEGLARWP